MADAPPPPHPRGVTLTGRLAWLRPLDAVADAPALFAAFADSPWVFDYMGEQAPTDAAALTTALAVWVARGDCATFAVGRVGSEAALGYACLMGVVPAMREIEIGNANLSPALQRSPLATEAFSLLLGWSFDAGYRRVVWKCNALNAPSRRAAQRLGFGYEGLFRQHMIVKGRNRDTAWFAMTDGDWPAIRTAHARWLDPANFDADGRQRQALGDLTAPHVVGWDPSRPA
ncbi:GNAT family N-acetyltransferase [Loktanella fryxellensis]|uniref:GNAT family N-acetyltransferase n=1 Tax=Loktanella fryxellensis TaxID=245187 RepID=UPI001FDEB58E|nr:GNAT family protein [Loktanella fryxellensis]